jgi:fructosamine-3-kinase
MTPQLAETISRSIEASTGRGFEAKHRKPQSEGCINESWVLSDDERSYFVKLNAAAKAQMFAAEADALRELAAAKAIRVPHPISSGTAGAHSFLIIESLPFGAGRPSDWEAMGRQLARLHRQTSAEFGWHRDNVIGSTPQSNPWTRDWPSFFRDQRLRPQFKLARQNGYQLQTSDELLKLVDALLAGHSPVPSLLHGDLWSGNAGFLEDGTPVIFDPATYYGDRETDVAFSEFFGGFPSAFYKGYESGWPLDPGYAKRKKLYNLYHVLNHLNLFGATYLDQSEQMTSELLSGR